MDVGTLWQLLNSGIVLLLLGASFKVWAQFTTHGNKIDSIECENARLARECMNAKDTLTAANLKAAGLEGSINTLMAKHDGFESWMQRIEQKIDRLDNKFSGHAHSEKNL